MATVAGRKKSIVSTTGLYIDTSANNTLLNKAASQSTSLYQQCSSLRARLLRITGFPKYFSDASSPTPASPPTPSPSSGPSSPWAPPLLHLRPAPRRVWLQRINNSSFNQDKYETNPDREKKHAIALFAMQIRGEKVMREIHGVESFTVTDLWDRNSTDGLVKVINTVTAIVDHLPRRPLSNRLRRHALGLNLLNGLPVRYSPPQQPSNPKDSEKNNIIKEMVETERKYVQDLEIMQKYSNALSQANLMDQDTIPSPLPNLNKLLNFQRKFLIRLEGTAELPWQDQRWGQTLSGEPHARERAELVPLNHLINVKGELPGLLIKPIQRICKYPLLLDSLIKACSPSTYPHYEELKRGSEAAKRITDKINEAQRHAENEQTVKSLHSRIDDWKGHHLENFGELLLDDIFVVTKSDIDREYHVFLFERIILCCKEATQQLSKNGKGQGKNGSILKKQPAPPPLTLPGGFGSSQKNTPLLLKGRIFLGNVTQAVPVPARASTTLGIPPHFPLAVWWKGDDDLEFFTLRCKREDQMRLWESTINRLIKEAAQRRNGTIHERPIACRRGHYSYDYDDSSSYTTASSSHGNGPKGTHRMMALDFEPDEDDLEDYPPGLQQFPHI
ncbi:Dbl homology domain-containing protein [Gymnopilus junonius]|uniref:Dbl homology domain-containing protein n=1 Tax=Gymnopilus junonius TaxID=109634 RepID=A0A9P5TE98_GYMJU|nr:Dbl homology domain-containing protein [Gymnopilus junonius]